MPIGSDGEPLVLGRRRVVGGAAVVADHAQHVPLVLRVTGERAEWLRHLGGGRVALAGHDRGQRAGDGAASSES